MKFFNKLLSLVVVLGITGMGGSVYAGGKQPHHQTNSTEPKLENLLKDKKDVAVIVVDPQETFSKYTGEGQQEGSLAVGGTDKPYVESMVQFTKALKDKGIHIVVSQDHHPAGHISFASTHTGANIATQYATLGITKVTSIDGKEIFYDGKKFHKSPEKFSMVRIYFEDNNYIDQMLWPDHGIQLVEGPTGDKLLPGLNNNTHYNYLQKKGTKQNRDSYSAFFDNEYYDSKGKPHRGESTGLIQYFVEQFPDSKIDKKGKEKKTTQINTLIIYGIATDFCVKATIQDALRLGFNVVFVENESRSVASYDSPDYKKVIKEMETKSHKKTHQHFIKADNLLVGKALGLEVSLDPKSTHQNANLKFEEGVNQATQQKNTEEQIVTKIQ